MADLVAELERIAAALSEAQVDYAVCGGLAVAIHGHVRATRDIDLLLPSEAASRALAALALRAWSDHASSRVPQWPHRHEADRRAPAGLGRHCRIGGHR